MDKSSLEFGGGVSMKQITLDAKDASPSEEGPIDEMVLDFLIDKGIIPSSFRWKLVIEYEENVK